MRTDAIDEAFVADLKRLFAERVARDAAFACDLYSAITQVDWTHDRQSGESGFTYRGADSVIYEISGVSYGFYMENGGVVSDEIASALAALGWRHKSLL